MIQCALLFYSGDITQHNSIINSELSQCVFTSVQLQSTEVILNKCGLALTFLDIL